jgi:DNA-binding transcriptional LysR family regulator
LKNGRSQGNRRRGPSGRSIEGPVPLGCHIFTHAALTLGCAQSSVTAQMKSLEEELGMALFNRVGNRLELTGPGERYLVYAERILALTREARVSLNDETQSGTLRFAAPESICTYLLPPLLKTFKASYPRVRIQYHPGLVEFQGVETIKHCVAEGLGIAPLPRIAVEAELGSGALVALPWEGEPIRISTYVVWNPERHVGFAEKVFLQHVRDHFRTAAEP